MIKQIDIGTDRLVFRAFQLEDAERVALLAGDKKVSGTTLNIPYPYDVKDALVWIGKHNSFLENDSISTYAIVLKESNILIGAISLIFNKRHKRAELAYWIGVPYWNKGYCTEASLAMLELGFITHGFNKIHASSLDTNPGSFRVMKKIGMKYDGIKREEIYKGGKFLNLLLYSILKSEYINS